MVLSRLCNCFVVRRRSQVDWKGAMEGKKWSDIFVLLSQDRWIILRGMTDDVKAVTSGQWLRDEKLPENWLSVFATVILYANAALASNMTQFGKMLLLGLLANSQMQKVQMHDRILQVDTEELNPQDKKVGVKPKPKRYRYDRRLDLLKDLIKKNDYNYEWAIEIKLIRKEDVPSKDNNVA
jgi:hypothetical protein